MARTIRPLTATEIKKALPAEKVTYLFDGGGLQVTIKPNGKKFFHFKYTSPTTRSRRTLSFGDVNNTTLANARERARKCRELLSEGVDPAEHFEREKQREREQIGVTFERIAREWLSFHQKKIRKSTLTNVNTALNRRLFPAFKHVNINSITAPMCISKFKTFEHSPAALSRSITIFNQIMAFAVNCGYIKYNPASTVGALFSNKKVSHLKSIELDEMPALLSEIDKTKTHYVAKLSFYFQLLTITRRTETAGAKWEEIKGGLWTIPADRMKNKKPHTVILSSQALEILKICETIKRNDYIFPATRNNSNYGHIAPETNANLILKTKFKGRMTAHGVRSMASTFLNEKELNPDIIETLLSHSSRDVVRATYNRARYEEKRREYWQMWGDYCERCGLNLTNPFLEEDR